MVTSTVHWLDIINWAPTASLPIRFLLRVHVDLTSPEEQRCFSRALEETAGPCPRHLPEEAAGIQYTLQAAGSNSGR